MNMMPLLESALDNLLAHIRHVVVVIRDGQRGAGAGVLAGDGLVLTNSHVVGRGQSLHVTLEDGESYQAQLLIRDPEVDLALLQIPVYGHPVAVLSTRSPQPGEMVFAFGHPWGQRNVLTGGVLSAITIAHNRRGQLPVLRSDVQLAPGNSGGPLLDAAGEVLGLNAMIFGGDQSLAIPASVIREFLAEAHKAMPRRLVPEEAF